MVRSAAAMSGRRCEERRRHADRNGGQGRQRAVVRNVEILRFLADQHGDGVRVLRTRHAGTDQSRLRRLEGHLRSDHGGRWGGGDARLPLRPGDPQRLAIGIHRLLVEIDEGIRNAQLDDGGGEQGLLGQRRVDKSRLIGLRGRRVLLDQPADLAPHVQRPGPSPFERRRSHRASPRPC